jgi:hypothetical protein
MMDSESWGVSSAGIALCMAAYGYKRKSLCKSGALAATLVGFISFYVGARFGVLLIAFFLTSSRITKIGAARKKLIEEDFKEGGMRDWGQVLANSAPGLLACSSYFYYFAFDAIELNGRSAAIATFLQMAYLGHYACCAGDTWASELGVLAKGPPILVTTCRKVAILSFLQRLSFHLIFRKFIVVRFQLVPMGLFQSLACSLQLPAALAWALSFVCFSLNFAMPSFCLAHLPDSSARW